ncbi:UNVERIFIED_CONTAM: Coiled-coil domain-containing protein 22 [Sesamum radiatum]|uniref:Coiled-coil domain-containing protein 22 n=1 Tax=Sesamum radiatum TaxID=300843 RepID=A0AAW2KH83_SESRA
MEASEEILLNSLANSGVPIPAGVSSVHDLTPPTLFYVCSQALRLIDGPHHASSFPASLPEDSTPDRVKICTDLASAFNNLGFNPDLSFHKNQELLRKPMVAKYSELQHADEERGLLEAALEMVLDDQHPLEFYIEQLNNQMEAKKQKLKELETEWDAKEKALQEEKRNLEQSLIGLYPEAAGKLTERREIVLETESILSEIKRREEELSKLSSDLEKQPKLAPRRSYIERINEITKNSRKQDNDIQRILRDTRELQLESNTIQERLNRTYAIVNETIFREAKKDPVARQAYRLLTNIHESFEQIAENILATDRSRRDAADYEAKLAIITARSLNMDKLQADLAAIRKENDLLEQCLHNL